MKKFLTRKFSYWIFLLIGTLCTALSFFPYIFLKEGAAVNYFDQLDGEIFSYIFSAKYFMQPDALISQVLSGAAQTAYTPPAPFFVLFFLFLPPFLAYLLMKFTVMILAFVGMYLCLKEIKSILGFHKGEIFVEDLAIMIIALSFGFLPYLYLYGLCIAGQPLLLYTFLRLAQNKDIVSSILIILFFGTASSLVLIGYADLIILFITGMLLLTGQFRNFGEPYRERVTYGDSEVYTEKKVHHKKISYKGKAFFRQLFLDFQERFVIYRAFFKGLLALLVTYIVLNLDLIFQVFGTGTSEISHKTELVSSGLPFLDQFKDLFINGIFHCQSCHKILIIPIILIIITCVIFYKEISSFRKRTMTLLFNLFILTIAITAFYAFWHITPVSNLRNSIGGLFVYFQIDRFYWLYPTLWYLMLGLAVMILMENTKTIGIIFSGILLIASSCYVLLNSDFKCNIRQMVNPETSTQMTWEDYYAQDLMSEIKDFIGKPQDSYRVVSLAMHPSAALYNGFYCIDGYSNNYSLEYKHLFRKIMENELEKNQYNRELFDGWGNRCYLMTDQLGQSFMIGKTWNVVVSEPISLNIEVLNQLNCQYLFSAVKILLPEKSGLTFLKSFTSDGSFYTVYLYKINQFE